MASPGKTPEKTESMLDWPLYTPPQTENASIKWPVQHRFCFTIDSVNDFDIDICLAVGFVRFRSHSKSFGFPIDEIDDIPPRFERGPSTL